MHLGEAMAQQFAEDQKLQSVHLPSYISRSKDRRNLLAGGQCEAAEGTRRFLVVFIIMGHAKGVRILPCYLL